MRLPGSRRYAIVDVVGPDGVGKTTLTEALVDRAGGRRHVLVVANREGGVPPTLLLRRRPGAVTRGHTALLPPYGPVLAHAKAVYMFCDHLAAWLVRVLPHARHTGMVVIERGWWDLAVDAPRYRLQAAVPAVRRLGRRLPRPDVMLVLDAPGEVVNRRKSQLPPGVVERHRQTWRDLRTGAPTCFLDAREPADEVLARALRTISATASARGRLAPLQQAEPLPVTDRSELLVPLLRELSAVAPSLVVWKNADRALEGDGDLDLLCAREEAGAVEEVFSRWADEHGGGPVVACEHGGNGRYLVTLAPDERFAELDVKWHLTARGAQLFRLEHLTDLVAIDDRGFRRLRPGAEGLLKLAVSGVRRDGAPRTHRLDREDVVDLLRADPAGAQAATRFFGRGAGPVTRAVGALVDGEWDRAAWLQVQLLLAGRSLRDPRALAGRVAPHGSSTCRGLKPLVTRGVVRADDADWLRHLPAPHGDQHVPAPGGTSRTTTEEV